MTGQPPSSPVDPERSSATNKSLVRRLFSRENLYAILLCLMLIAILILTAGQSPQWIYQGF